MIIPLNIHAGAFLLCFGLVLLFAAFLIEDSSKFSWFFDYGMFSHRNGNNFCGYSCSVLVPCATPCHINPFLLLKELFFMLYPYAISRESVNGHRVWIAKSLHLKSCVAQGDTRLEAIKELESNEIAWLETARMLHIPQSN